MILAEMGKMKFIQSLILMWDWMSRYWIVVLGVVVFVVLVTIILLVAPRGKKLLWIAVTTVGTSIPFYIGYKINLKNYESKMEKMFAKKPEEIAREEKVLRDYEVFKKRCVEEDKEVIYKTVDNVDGVTLLKLRGKNVSNPDQYLPDIAAESDMYFYELGYVFSFLELKNKIETSIRDEKGLQTRVRIDYERAPNYQYVDVLDPDRNYKRYFAKDYQRLAMKHGGSLEDYKNLGKPLKNQPSRYTVDFINDIHFEDRERWIASTRIMIKDSKTGELLAEKTWFLFDPAQGYKGQRAFENWKYAGKYCENNDGVLRDLNEQKTMRFVSKVLKTNNITEIKE